MKAVVSIVVAACLTAGCGITSAAPTKPLSGIDTQYVDNGVRAQDDFYRHVNGKWLATTELPADRGQVDNFSKVHDETQEGLRRILEGLQKSPDAADPDQRKIADLYSGFMDEATLERLGRRPLGGELTRIDALKDKGEIPALIAHLQKIDVTTPYHLAVGRDAKDPTRYAVIIGQDGLGMPDRDYYLQDDPRMRQVREKYGLHVARVLELGGDRSAADDAKGIVALETELARAQWTRTQNRDDLKTYNKMELPRLAGLAPGYDWKGYLGAAGVEGRTDSVVVSQPSYLGAFGDILQRTPLEVWKAYFRWHLLDDFSPYLNKDFSGEAFAFAGTVVRGIPQQRPRWQRGMSLVDDVLGESLGRLYVARYFPQESKASIDRLVKNLLSAYQADIDTLDWMGPETKSRAREKLARMTVKIGFPSAWRDYSGLRIVRDDLVGNLMRADVFEYERGIARLGKPVDRTEWFMNPQEINAYYSPENNEIVFPAGILQPPFFNPKADDAANYGGIGAVIGHEISHGFDDQGSQYDGDGRLLETPGWFTRQDLDNFRARTRALVDQYAAFAPVPGYQVNGELTLGENIADNAGLAIAYKAYQRSLAGRKAPMIDGLTGEQRFFMSFAQTWRQKVRESDAIMDLKTDPHAPSQFRGALPQRNMAAFYDAFGIKEGDKMYLAPDKRITLW